MSDMGPREEDGDYAKEFFDTYERAAALPAAHPLHDELDDDCGHAGGCGTWVGFSCDCKGLWE